MTAPSAVFPDVLLQDEQALTILLVEDDANDAELVEAHLREAAGRARVMRATTLDEGLRALQEHEVQLILIDLDLPDSAGFATLERIRAATRAPVIVVSGNPHPELLAEGLKRGAYEVLPKSELDAGMLERIVRLAGLQSRMQESLRLTERRYHALLEGSREPIALLGAGGELHYGNPALRRLLWQGTNVIELVHPFERQAAAAEYAKLVQAAQGRSVLKAHFRQQDGSWRLLEATLHNRLAEAEVDAVVASFADVAAHAGLEERFRATFDQAAVGIAHIAEDGRFQLVNRKLCEILGYSREELCALTVFDISHPQDRNVTPALRRRMRARDFDSFSTAKRYVRKDGGVVWVEVAVSLVRAADGSPSYEIAVFEDISARREAAEALQRSERRFRALIENSADGILLVDENARLLYASPGARRTLGYAQGKAEKLDWDLAEVVHADDRGRLAALLAGARKRPGVTQEVELRVRHASGAYRLLAGTCTDLSNDATVRATVFNLRDITEREHAEARARRVARMYAALSAATEAAAQLHDEAQLNQKICEIAVEHGDMALATVRMLEPGSSWLGMAGHAGALAAYLPTSRISVDPALPEGQGLAGEAMREGRTTVSNDFLAEPKLRPWHEPAREAGIAAVACIPLRRGGVVAGLLVLYSRGVGWFDSDLVTLAERMAASLSQALDRLDTQMREARLKAMYAALSAANEAIMRASSVQELLRSACEIAVQAGGFLLGTVFLLDRSSGRLTRAAASGPAAASARADFSPSADDTIPGGQGLIGLCCRSGAPQISNDYQSDTRAGQGSRQDGAAAVAVFPLRVEGELAGVFGLRHGERGVFSEELTGLLARLADNISFALANFGREERFRTVVDSANEGILVYDREHRIVAANAAAGRIIATPVANLIGKPGFTSLFPCINEDGSPLDPEDRPTRATARGGVPLTGRLVGIVRPDHSVTWLSVNTAFLRRPGEAGYYGLVSTINDVTAQRTAIEERLQAEERLQQSVERFEIVARATNDVVYDWNLLTDQLWWNENFRMVFGYELQEVGAYADAWTSRIHPDDVEFVRGDIRTAIDGGYRTWSGEYRFRRKDGSYAAVHDRGLVIRDSGGNPVRMIGAMVDITARKESERRIRLHAQRSGGIARLGQFALDADDLDQVFAEAVRLVRVAGGDVAAILEQVGPGEYLTRAASGEGAEGNIGLRAPLRPGGVHVPILGEHAAFGLLGMRTLHSRAFEEDDLRFAEAIANVLTGTVRRHQTQTRLAYMAEFDGLTGLPNRNLLQDRLTQTIAQARRHAWQGAVLFIDLDRFKLVNDTLGHHVGDALLAEAGKRLKQCIRSGDAVGRVSGDEFGVVLSELAAVDDAALVAQKILDALSRPFDLTGNEAYVTASIGISVFPADGDDAETLLKNADMAMYRAKEMTRNAYCFFTAEMNQRSAAKLQLNTDLRHAIERGEFVLHYQPKVDLRDGRVLGVEALLRWNHPQRGVVSPAEFIPALEDSGLILPVGEWVLREACTQLRRWQLDSLEPVPVAVNLSAKQFHRRDMDAIVHRALSLAGVAAGLIELEVTESCLMSDPEEAVRLLANLRAAGLKISIDDFGTGYSSLSYLTRLPLNSLKIDRSFVQAAAASSEAASIVRAIIDMAHNLHFTVIAEGVETEEQVAFLRRHGCDQGQGYYFDRPVPAAELARRLARAA